MLVKEPLQSLSVLLICFCFALVQEHGKTALSVRVMDVGPEQH